LDNEGAIQAPFPFMTHPLIESRDRLIQLCRGLSPEKTAVRLSDAAWTIAEIVEHLAITERGSMVGVKRSLGQAEAAQELLAQTTDKTNLIQARIPTVVRKVVAPEFVQPSGRFKDWPSPLIAFEQERANTIAMEAAADSAYDNRVMPHPILGPLTLRQWFYFTSAHTERHTKQIEEILAQIDA
jgi:hypothetical protein